MAAPLRVSVHGEELPLALVGVGSNGALAGGGEALREVDVVFGMVVGGLLCVEHDCGQARLQRHLVSTVGVDVVVEHIHATRSAKADNQR